MNTMTMRSVRTEIKKQEASLQDRFMFPGHCFGVDSYKQSISKRVFDIVASGMLLLLTAPLMLILAVMVKLDSEGPVFYSQVRVGSNRRRQLLSHHEGLSNRRNRTGHGREFKIYKFRSMVTDAEKDGEAVWCKLQDPRITRMGSLLRMTHLDELPQLLNILKGDMSLVGPRPERPEIVRDLVEQIPDYENRLLLNPGLTGLAQTRHRADLGLSDVMKKVRYDIFYLNRSSLLMDMKIMIDTIPMMAGVPAKKIKKMGQIRIFQRMSLAIGSALFLAGAWIGSNLKHWG